jgi:hypothetical protein
MDPADREALALRHFEQLTSGKSLSIFDSLDSDEEQE